MRICTCSTISTSCLFALSTPTEYMGSPDTGAFPPVVEADDPFLMGEIENFLNASGPNVTGDRS